MEVDRTFSQWSIGTPRIRWSAVFAGWAVGLALQIVLTLAGLGIGAWAVDLHDANPTEGIPVGAAVWTGLSTLISAFVGGYMTARLSGSGERGDGLYHGVVLWGVNWLVFAWLTTTAMATMIGGAFSVFGTTLQTVADGLSHSAAASVPRPTGRVNLRVEDLRREIDAVVRATRALESAPDVPQAAGRGAREFRQAQTLERVTDHSLTELRDRLSALDREAAVNLMINRYGLTDAEAKDVVQSTIGLLSPAEDMARSARQRSASLGAEALDRLGMIALWLSGLGLISLIVSALGGMLGTPEEALVETTTRAESYLDIRRAS
jgi:hypothetical protein